MNKQRLKKAEKAFFMKYPAGFEDPAMVALGKKHRMEQQIAFAQESFGKSKFSDVGRVTENITKQISRSSMVSMFEKPKFRDFAAGMSPVEAEKLTGGLKKFLHGKQSAGFETMVDVLKQEKLAKWSLITIIPNYYHPDTEVFIKPTTTKGVIEQFQLRGVQYKPQPTWEFYEAYRDLVMTMKASVDPLLAPSNAAFLGFLMMSLG